MIVLYEHPLSPYAQKIKIALMEKGVEFESRIPDGIGAGGVQGEFASAGPRLEVPALIDGEASVFDSTIILEYIEDKWPEPALLHGAPAGRAKQREIEDILDTQFEAILWGLGELRWFKRAEGALAQTMEDAAATQIAAHYRWLERRLDGALWFSGAAFGWGDLSAAPYVNSAIDLGHAPPAGSQLASWVERVNERPSVAAVRQAAQDASAAMAQVAEAVRMGLFKREYRDHRLEWIIKSGGLAIVTSGLENGTIRFVPDPD